MTKKSSFCLVVLSAMFGCGLVAAQEIQKSQSILEVVNPAESNQEYVLDGAVAKKLPSIPVNSAIKLAEDECWWGYFTGIYEGGNDPYNWRKQGYGQAITYACAIKIPADNQYGMGTGKTIKGIKFAFPDAKNIDDVKIWMSHELPAETNMSDADICVQNIAKADLVSALNSTPDNFLNEVRFDKPYAITDKDVYVGYTFRMTKVEDDWDSAPVVLVDEPTVMLGVENAYLRRYNEESEWDKVEDAWYGILAMQVLLQGEFKQNAAEIEESFYDVSMLKNTTTTVPVQFSNQGREGLRSFKYKVTTDNVVTNEQTVTLDTLIQGLGTKYTYDFPLFAGANQGVCETDITITEVNGLPNEIPVVVCQGDVVVLENELPRKVFCEDYTGTWSRGAPWGFINKYRVKEKYGEDVVFVTVHIGNNDPMSIPEYAYYTRQNDIKRIPNVFIDRTIKNVYPYLGVGEDLYFEFAFPEEIERAKLCYSVATVDVKGKLESDGETITVETDVRFGFSGEKDNYTLVYILTKDGLQNDSWIQDNGMGEYKGMGIEKVDPLFESWINGEEQVKGVVYDDVAIAASDLTEGVFGSINSQIEIGASQIHKYEFKLSDCFLAEDTDNLYVCAVLIDTESSKVINADKKAVEGSKVSGIESRVLDDAVEVERYSIDGQKINAPIEGINIVRYSDGRVVKEFVW